MLSSDKNIEYIADFVEEAKHWLSLRTEYTKLDMADKIVRIVTALIVTMVLLVMLMLILIYLSFSLAYAIDEHFGSLSLGFLCVSGFYLLMLIVVLSKRHSWIERPLVRFLMSILRDNSVAPK